MHCHIVSTFILWATVIGFVAAVIKSPYWCFEFILLYTLFGTVETRFWKDTRTDYRGTEKTCDMFLPSVWSTLKSEE